MKIIIINGSPRKNGATAKLNQALYEHLLNLNPDIELETIELSDVNPKYCKGCLYCYRKGVCHIQADDMEAISTRVSLCDGVVFASPTYGSSVTGLFKTFIDRGHFLVEQMLHDKPCVVMTSYENAQGSKAVSFMNQTVMTSGGYSVGKIAVKVPFNGNPITSRIEQKLSRVARKLYHAAQADKSKKPIFPRIFNAIAFHVVLKPHAVRCPEEYRGVVEHWIERGLVKKEILS